GGPLGAALPVPHRTRALRRVDGAGLRERDGVGHRRREDAALPDAAGLLPAGRSRHGLVLRRGARRDRMTDAAGPATFRTTRWSVVVAARTLDDASRDALETLCRTYWFPLYALARRRGAARHEAEDLVQGFFAA